MQKSIAAKDFLSTTFVQNLSLVCSKLIFKSLPDKRLRCPKKVRKLSEMANKEPVTQADIREVAKQLRQFADDYDAIASKMADSKVKSVLVAMETLRSAVLPRITANVNNLNGRLNDQIRNSRKAAAADIAADITQRAAKKRKPE